MKFSPKLPYDLPKLPPEIELTEKTKVLLADAREALAGLKASLEFFENPMQLVSKLVLQESVSSSKIENIRTTIIGSLEDSIKNEEDIQAGNKETLNYREALLEGWKQLLDYSLSSRTIGAIHEVLKVKGAGKVRAQQNAIKGSYDEIIYTPPQIGELPGLLSNWENFVNNSKKFHPIVKAIIAHYQFEAIHPFADGNGRTGRILITLQLLNDGIINVPIFFISGYLHKYSDEYKKLLLKVTTDKDWDSFINFMLIGFSTQATKTKELISSIHKLKLSMKRAIRSELPKIYSIELIDALFNRPVTSASYLEKDLNITRKTAAKYLKILAEHEYLKNKKSGRYNFYFNYNLINTLRD